MSIGKKGFHHEYVGGFDKVGEYVGMGVGDDGDDDEVGDNVGLGVGDDGDNDEVGDNVGKGVGGDDGDNDLEGIVEGATVNGIENRVLS